MKSRIKTLLLTLSACDTAATRADANGKEIDGFAELAQRLGANAVMATLWQVRWQQGFRIDPLIVRTELRYRRQWLGHRLQQQLYDRPPRQRTPHRQ